MPLRCRISGRRTQGGESMNTTAQSPKPITPTQLAGAAVEEYIRNRTVIKLPAELPEELKAKAAAFVSIKSAEGKLRGCIGSIYPMYENVALDIVKNAIKAATEDYRFQPVRLNELGSLVYSVDILSAIVAIGDLEGHDPKIYGLLIETAEGRRGVLLPDLEGINTADEQISALRHKIGLYPDTPVKMSRFSVTRFGKK